MISGKRWWPCPNSLVFFYQWSTDSMHRFSGVVYNPDSQTVDIGAGLIWDDVYEALEP
jgi:hypothetical protein